MRKRYNTPHRSHVVKTRMTEEEYAEFTERLKNYDMSQAEFIRQAIARATIRPIVTVSPVNDELLSAVGKLTAEYGRIQQCDTDRYRAFRAKNRAARQVGVLY